MFRTLIVEDNSIFRQITKDMMLARFPNMTISEAANGEEALKAVNSACPEIILMDIKLPGKNGIALTREIRNTYPQVTVIILTSYDFPEYREVALEHGAKYYFVKGTSKSNDILAAVDSILQRSRAVVNTHVAEERS